MAYDGTLRFDTSMDSSGFQKDANKLGDIVKGLGVFELIKKGLDMVAGSIDSAVSRYDTLNKFPKIMEQMGYGGDVAEKSMQRLSDSIQGLPTTLDEIVGNTRQFTIALSDLDKGTDSAIAVNNAFLASGASAQDAARGTTQYLQMLSSGKVDMMSWRTLNETMTYALQSTAASFGFAGASAKQDLYAALRDGDITFSQFNDRIIELNGGIGGFAEVAKTATGGIGTAWTNFHTAVVRGTEGIIRSIDTGLSQTRFKSIENVISSAGKVTSAILRDVAAVAGFVAENFETLAPIVIGVAAAFSAYSIIGTVTTAFKGMQTAIAAADAILTKSTLNAGKDVAMRTALTAALASETTAEAVRTAAAAAGMAIDAAGNLITAQGTAATAAQTVAVLTNSGALTAKTVIVGLLTGQIGLVTAAQWLWNAAMAANPIGLIVAGIAVLVGVIVGLIALLSKGSEEYQKQKKELEELSKAHEEYAKRLDENQAAAKQAIATTKAQADANNDLVSNLRNLMATNDAAGSNNDAIAQTIDQLNQSVDGLGLAYDETTRKLSANIDQVEAYVKAQDQLLVIKAQEDEYNRLLSEQLNLQAKIRVEEARQAELLKQKDEGIISQREYNDLIKRSNDLIKDYGVTETKLAVDVQAAHAAIDTAAKRSANAQIDAYKAINGARDAEGNNLKQLAKLYDTTTDQILAEMREQGVSMEEWSVKKAALFTKEGQSLQGVAAQWGMTTDEVTAYMSEWGMTLDEFVAEMEATHTKEGLSLEQLAEKWGTTSDAIKFEMDNMELSMQDWSDMQQQAWKDYAESVKERTQGVINSFKEIPKEYDMSAKEMLKILIANKERYAEWEATMKEITRQLGPTAAEEFGKLGPEATSALQEILDSAKLLDQYRDVFGVKLDEVTGAAIEDWNDPNFIGAPSDAIDTSAQMVTENSALSDAVTSQMEGALAAAEAVDFTEVGQSISAEILDGLNSADVSGAMSHITDAIQSNTGSVTSAATNMSTSVQNVIKTMSTQSQSAAEQMMTNINSAIVSRTGTVKSSTTALENSVVTIITEMKTKATSMAEQMMTSINSAIVTRTPTVKSSTTALANGTVSSLEPMVSGAEKATNNMMAGILAAMTNKAQSLYDKAREIANKIAATLAAAWDEHSPSRVSYKIMAFFMQAMYNAMDDMSGLLYREADSIADGLVERLAFSPDVLREMVDQMRVVTETNQLGGVALVPQLALAGAGAGVSYSTNLVQNITTPKPLSASEMTREGQDLLRRSRWQLP